MAKQRAEREKRNKDWKQKRNNNNGNQRQSSGEYSRRQSAELDEPDDVGPVRTGQTCGRRRVEAKMT